MRDAGVCDQWELAQIDRFFQAEPQTRTERLMCLIFRVIRRDAVALRTMNEIRDLTPERKRDLLALAKRWLAANQWRTFSLKVDEVFDRSVKLCHLTFKLPAAPQRIVKLQTRECLRQVL